MSRETVVSCSLTRLRAASRHRETLCHDRPFLLLKGESGYSLGFFWLKCNPFIALSEVNQVVHSVRQKNTILLCCPHSYQSVIWYIPASGCIGSTQGSHRNLKSKLQPLWRSCLYCDPWMTFCQASFFLLTKGTIEISILDIIGFLQWRMY